MNTISIKKVLYLLIFITLAIFENLHAIDELINTRSKEFQLDNWINSRPLSLDDLRGKVVLIRWWTGPDCPFCSASSVALNEWYTKYRDQNFLVIGIYHHKKESPLSIEEVNKLVSDFGFKFPVAIDTKWRMLKQWWLDGKKRDWTSVSFLLDKTGIIRHVHEGGSYVKGEESYTKLEDKIRLLLKQTS